MRSTIAFSLLSAGLAASACSGTLEGTGEPTEQDPAVIAREKFDTEVLPIAQSFCSACHASAAGGIGPGFLIPPDVYQSVKDSGLIIPGDPNMSRFLTFSISETHTGTNFTPEQAQIVREWIEMEPPDGSLPPPMDAETAKLTPVVGYNEFDLGLLATGLEGAKVTFTFERLTAGVYLSQLQVVAGANGVHLFHPLFTYWTPDPNVDPVDSFYGYDLIVNPGETKTLGGGTLVLVDVPVDAQLTIHFEVLENGMEVGGGGGGGGGVTGGCVNVAGFTANAQPRLDAQCFSCHGGGDATARNAFDLSALRDLTEAGQLAACGQTKGKINLADPPSSILFQRVEPGQITNHPLTITDPTAFAAFRDPVVTWANTEQP